MPDFHRSCFCYLEGLLSRHVRVLETRNSRHMALNLWCNVASVVQDLELDFPWPLCTRDEARRHPQNPTPRRWTSWRLIQETCLHINTLLSHAHIDMHIASPTRPSMTPFQDVEVPFHPNIPWQPRRASAPMGHLHLPSSCANASHGPECWYQ